MIKIEKRYILDEITIKVNNRKITYDKPFQRIIYTYKGINKEEFKLTYKKWDKVCTKYKLWQDYSFCKYEEISK